MPAHSSRPCIGTTAAGRDRSAGFSTSDFIVALSSILSRRALNLRRAADEARAVADARLSRRALEVLQLRLQGSFEGGSRGAAAEIGGEARLARDQIGVREDA